MSAMETTLLQRPKLDYEKPKTPSFSFLSFLSDPLRLPCRWTGFTMAFNLGLLVLTAGILSAFCISRLPYLDHETWLTAAAPGEEFWFKDGMMKLGMKLHLWSVVRKYSYDVLYESDINF
jgi:hypothetical protein